MTKGLEKLKADTAKAKATDDVLENAKLYQAEVLEDMAELKMCIRDSDDPDSLQSAMRWQLYHGIFCL